jgi:hypothetical protein
LSVTSVALRLARQPPTPRQIIDQAVTAAQLLPRLRDGGLVLYWRITGNEAPGEARAKLAFCESIFGAITMGLIISSIILQSKEELENVSAEDARTLLALKGTLNL